MSNSGKGSKGLRGAKALAEVIANNVQEVMPSTTDLTKPVTMEDLKRFFFDGVGADVGLLLIEKFKEARFEGVPKEVAYAVFNWVEAQPMSDESLEAQEKLKGLVFEFFKENAPDENNV